MTTKIDLKPGYDPDKYRDELCEKAQLIRETMSLRDYMIYINEKARKSPLHKKFENENEGIKPT